ncbi:immunoglobulin-like domain-containing protein [Hyunsoonleella rubra]|uniref:Immunoglobulin-like domain-containing protein n=1 Tax=Hyunsoonleella rubra TaxID=1737062 RepID=A0ABW5T9D8_9FLAO
MKKILFLFSILLNLSLAFSQQINYKRVSISNPSSATISQMAQSGIDLQCGAIYKDGKLQLELSQNELTTISRLGVPYNVLIDDLSTYYADRAQKNLPRARQELQAQKGFQSKAGFGKSSVSSVVLDNIGQYNGCDEINWSTPTNFKLGSMGGCLTVSEALAELDLMRSLYPNIISVKADASPTNQTTVEGRTTYYVRISDNPDIDESGEPETLYTGMTHSRELSSLMNLMYYMWYILENYGTDPAITNLVNNQELYFIPIVNSDGLAYNESVLPNGGGLQRKNRNIYNGSCGTTSEGVDLNRNFGYYWGNGGSSTNTCSETYRGPTFFSEPESQIVRDFFLQHDFKLVLNHHSFKNAMLHGYAGVDPATLDAAGVDRREDEFAKYNHDMTHFNRYAYGPSTQISALNSGNMNDWMMGPAVAGSTGGPGAGINAMAWTPENGSGSEAGSTGSGFWPDPLLIDDIARRAMRGNFLAAYFSGKYAKLIDLSPSNITALNGNLNFGIEYLGQTASDFTLSVTPVSANINSISSPSSQVGMSALEQRNVVAAYSLDNAIQANDIIEFNVALSNDDGVIYQANIKKYYTPNVQFVDDPDTDGTSNWTAAGGSWGTISVNGFSGTATTAITDSPSGSYANNESKTLQLNSTIATTGVNETIIQYYAKWDLERSFDYVQIEASTNGSTWTPLCGTYTKPGAPNENNTYSGKSTANNNFQPDGEQLYDGDTQDKWVMEEIIIDGTNNSAYFNEPTVYLRFNFNTDGSNRQDSYTTSFDGFVFDDFRVLGVQIPCVLSVPVGLSVSNIGVTTATLTWDQVTSATYDIRYKAISDTNWSEINDVNGLTTDISGLTESTDYEVQIRSRCTSNTSNYSSSVNFTTNAFVACTGTSIASFPYNEGFEGSIGDWSQSTADDLNWLVNSNATPSQSTGPSGAIEGSSYIYVEASVEGTGYPNKRAIISSPCFDLTGMIQATFSFKYHMFGASDMGTIDLEVSNDNGTNWTSLWSQSGNQGDTWLSVDVNLDAYVGSSVQLRFNRFVGSTWQADIAIDDVVVTTFDGVDSTPPVITLNGSSPTDVIIGATYTDEGATATDNIDGDITANIVIGGDTVDSNTLGTYVVTYDVSDAAGNAATQLTRTVNVIDAPSGCTGGISTYPYAFGFEGTIGTWTQSGADDLDWLVNSNNTPSNNTGPLSAIEGTSYIFVEASGNNTGYPNKRAIITSPCFDLSSASGADFSFQYHMFGASDMGTIDLELSSDDGANWTSIWNQSGNQGNSWLTVNLNLDAYIGASIQLRFNRVTGGTWQADIAIDDINLTADEQDTIAPIITLIGNATVNLNVGDTYTEEGATATDNIDGDISASIVIGGDTVDTNTGGTYVVTYDVSDAAGNPATQVTRTVNIIPDTTAPVITLVGNATIDLNVGDTYTEQGATASDNIDGDISASIVIGGDTVDTNTGGTYVVTYDVSDGAGNAATQATRTVNVIPDTAPPVITLIGSASLDINLGGTYTEQGATATDNIDGDITANIVIGGDTVDTNTAGTYIVTYNVSDAAGNAATQVTRTVNVIPDTTPPVITLIGSASLDINLGGTYTEQGATATDNIDGDITANIVIGGDTVDTNTAGTYIVTYDVSDAAGNAATQVTRTVNIIPDTTAPVITLVGNATINLNVGDTYTEEGATATDNIDGDITANIVIGGDTVDTNTAGTYLVTYDVSDAAGNAATQVTRTVNVIPDTTAPVITLVGGATVNLNLGDAYTEEGATAIDNIDGDITANIVIGGDTVDTNTGGTYIVTYDVSDAAGNAATQVTRTVNIIPDTTAPVITLVGNATINLNVGDTYTEEGATATDNIDGDITANIVIGGDTVDTNTASTYLVTYDVSDAAGNAATQVTRTVNVIPDTTAPVITLVGNATVNLNVGDTYTEEGATATDNIDGDITANIVIGGDTVDTNTGGTYVVTYDVSDAAGNPATQVTRTVNVIPDTSAPIITLIGSAIIDLNVGDNYTEQGATATDNIDGDISANISIGGLVDTNTAGTYVVTYDVSDAAGNAATQVARTVNVNDVPTDVIIHEGYFETGWDGWIDGGSDCARRQDSRSFEGAYSIRIRDNSGVASSMTSPTFDLSSFNEVEFNFYFYSQSMEIGEDFWLQYDDGSGFVTVETWARGTDFNNDAFGNFSVLFNSSQYNLSSNARFRLQCDASVNNDQIFIDQVVITGFGGSGATAKMQPEETQKTLDNEDDNNVAVQIKLVLYPNPVKGSELNISLTGANGQSNTTSKLKYLIVNALGQLVQEGKTDKKIVVDRLEAGVYSIRVKDGDKLYSRRFVKE